MNNKIIIRDNKIDIQLYCLWNFLTLFEHCTFCNKEIQKKLTSFIKNIEYYLFNYISDDILQHYDIKDEIFHVKTIYERYIPKSERKN